MKCFKLNLSWEKDILKQNMLFLSRSIKIRGLRNFIFPFQTLITFRSSQALLRLENVKSIETSKLKINSVQKEQIKWEQNIKEADKLYNYFKVIVQILLRYTLKHFRLPIILIRYGINLLVAVKRSLISILFYSILKSNVCI